MVIQETFSINGRDFIRSYSNAGFYIHGGSPEGDYSEACDPAELNRTYTETNIPIDGESEAEEILNVLLGGDAE